MIESRAEFAGAPSLRLARGPGQAAEAVVLFPGFPGHAPAPDALHGPPKLRVAIAKVLLTTMDADAYLPGYPGLDAPGRFSFRGALDTGIELGRRLASSGYRRVHFVGHSWGAFVAFNAHREIGSNAGKLALLSGVLDFPDEAAVRRFLPYYLTHFPEVLGAGAEAFERTVRDLDGARLARNPLTLVSVMSAGSLLLVHGRRDTEVDVSVSRRFHERAGGRFVELDADHGFVGRLPEVCATAADFFTTSDEI